jgi:hypothetical protein
VPTHFSGPALQAQREAAGVTRELLAVRTRKSYPSIVSHELGRAFPPANVVAELADAIGCRVADLFANDEPVGA